jgi:hypothetical protein
VCLRRDAHGVGFQTLKIVAKIKTGARPARISTSILPLDRVNTPAATGGQQ